MNGSSRSKALVPLKINAVGPDTPHCSSLKLARELEPWVCLSGALFGLGVVVLLIDLGFAVVLETNPPLQQTKPPIPQVFE